MAKIFITGITGFLGSNIAAYLLKNDHAIIATYRQSSAKKLCTDFEDKVQWVMQDEEGWQDKVIAFKPEVIVHAAWLGVGHLERDSWESQLPNIDFTEKILLIGKQAGIKKFIGCGSQAEYGVFNGNIDEQYPLKPVQAYGCVKVICAELVEQFCIYHKIDWYWLRLFSFFGKGEADNWLIPAVIKKMMTGTEMDLSPGEQQYAYLYVEDLALAINNIIQRNGKLGIYNISGKYVSSIKNLMFKIRDKINPAFKLNFGKLPYRSNQSMHIQGNSAKFIKEFGEFEVSDFDTSLNATIKYFKEQFN